MKSQIDQLRSEAEANFSASRWEDSAKTYEHLVGLAQNNHEYEQAIDFAIAAIRAWNKISNMKHRINRLYQAVGLIGIKKAAIGFEELAKQAEDEKNPKVAASNFEEAGNGYSLIQSYDKAKSCYEHSIKFLEALTKEAQNKKDFEASIHLLDRVGGTFSKLMTLMDRIIIERKDLDQSAKETIDSEKNRFTKNIIISKKQKATAHEKLAKYYCSKDDADCKIIAKKEYQNAITILEGIGEVQLAEKVKTKLSKLSKK